MNAKESARTGRHLEEKTSPRQDKRQGLGRGREERPETSRGRRVGLPKEDKGKSTR